jgi:choline dehydrogenase
MIETVSAWRSERQKVSLPDSPRAVPRGSSTYPHHRLSSSGGRWHHHAVLSQSFDFIIVGAGTAGCVLANRLSERPEVSVCLIEAGARDVYPLIKVPAAVAFTILNPKLGWGYETVPQPHCNNRRVVLPRGRVLGGSSSTNGMVYIRGHPGDYDDWAAAGARGWSYAELLPYFLRSEHNPAFADSPYHHVGGPMAVSNIPRVNPLVSCFLDSVRSLSLKHCADFNGADPEGFGTRQGTIRDGRRESGVTAFLRPAQGRPNLKIIVNALAHHVLLEQQRAVGVLIERDGLRSTIMARREVILSAGSYGSPALLMRSGIGPAEQLKSAGVQPIQELSGVGQGLRDHPSADIQMVTRDTTSYGVSLPKTFANALTLLRYLAFRSGPIASNLFEAHGFIKSDPRLPRPDLQIIMVPARRNEKPLALPRGHGFGIIAALVRPKSFGSIRIASPDPRDKPLIDLNLLADYEDVVRIRKGLRLARRILSGKAFEPYRATELKPGSNTQSDEQLEQHIRQTCAIVHHPTSSCRMGDDAAAVVDWELKVRGADGLRVIDASICPTLPAGNTNAIVVMIAEKGADLILGRPAPAASPLPHAH